jgi:hypothetical protein
VFQSQHCKTVSHFKQAELYNLAKIKKDANFTLTNFQAQLKFKQSDFIEAQKRAKYALELAEKEGIELTKEDEIFKINFRSG